MGVELTESQKANASLIVNSASRLNSIFDSLVSNINNSQDKKIESKDYATSSIGGTVKARLDGTTLYLTTNGSNA